MKKRMIVAALLVVPMSALLAVSPYQEQTVEERMGGNAYSTRQTPGQTVTEEYMHESLDVPYQQQVTQEWMGEDMYAPQTQTEQGYMSRPYQREYEKEVVRTPMRGYYIEEGSVVGSPMMTPEQRAAHSRLMNEVKQTSGKKPSTVAAQKKKTTTKKTPAKTTTKKTTPTKKATTKKTTTNGKKVASHKAKAKTGKQTAAATKKKTHKADKNLETVKA